MHFLLGGLSCAVDSQLTYINLKKNCKELFMINIDLWSNGFVVRIVHSLSRCAKIQHHWIAPSLTQPFRVDQVSTRTLVPGIQWFKGNCLLVFVLQPRQLDPIYKKEVVNANSNISFCFKYTVSHRFWAINLELV